MVDPVAVASLPIKEGSPRGDLLRTAIKLTEGDRQATYGSPKANLSIFASLVSAYLGHTVDAHDVAVIMVLAKISRMKGKLHLDNYIDAAAYAAIAGEVHEPE